MKINLKYIENDGTESRIEVGKDQEKLWISDTRIKEIDLSPLSECTNLKEITIERTHGVTSIDFSPLSECTNLEKVLVRGNKITEINLTPFRYCLNMKSVWISNTRLDSIDLTPLKYCKKLEYLTLDSNRLESIDLVPLKQAPLMKKLYLERNKLKTIDLSDLGQNIVTLLLSSNQLERLDLTPFAKWSKFEYLDSSFNNIKVLDLNPLSCCISLRRLNFHSNPLDKIDLSPLSSCGVLREIVFTDCGFKEIDLTPLSELRNLERLSIGDYHLKTLNLNPLRKCKNLINLGIHHSLRELDITPLIISQEFSEKAKRAILNRMGGSIWFSEPLFDILSSLERKRTHIHDHIKFGKTQPTIQWNTVIDALEKVKKVDSEERNILMMFLQQDIIAILGLQQYGLIDCDIDDLFGNIPKDATIEEVREISEREALRLICKQIDTSGITTGLAIQDFSNVQEIIKRLPRIMELRNEEMDKTLVLTGETWVDLKSLWLTAQGFTLLKSLGAGLAVQDNDLNYVVKTFAENGIDLKITSSKKKLDVIDMPEHLKNYIWWYAKEQEDFVYE